ncbi:hypothetical protein KI387_039672 [Taxus chinensis]|uniref:Uncharacterized protein n=1 Tax=Taxus chinensis TaxID=29808 RepID=A0AA38CG67_TAXCH|nr:hypothetical protein KI387_039672 [Taxus chinensis]
MDLSVSASRQQISRSGSGKMKVCMEPLVEGPTHELCNSISMDAAHTDQSPWPWIHFRHWIFRKRPNFTDSKLLLGVLGCPLAPLSVSSTYPFSRISVKTVPIGLDPRTTANVFLNARCVGEKRIEDEECFALKVAASPSALAERNDGPAEIIRHVLFGYFSQRTGLLVYMEDSHLTRIESAGGDAVYWETTIETTIHDYRPVDGIMIAHAGRSVVTVFKFGGQIGITYAKTRMEETWVIEEMVFNVPGLSMECFIPPADVKKGSGIGDHEELKFGKFGKENAWQTCLKQSK